MSNVLKVCISKDYILSLLYLTLYPNVGTNDAIFICWEGSELLKAPGMCVLVSRNEKLSTDPKFKSINERNVVIFKLYKQHALLIMWW